MCCYLCFKVIDLLYYFAIFCINVPLVFLDDDFSTLFCRSLILAVCCISFLLEPFLLSFYQCHLCSYCENKDLKEHNIVVLLLFYINGKWLVLPRVLSLSS